MQMFNSDKTFGSRRLEGFSLVELSIVLVIIGLLVAGALAGKTLLKSTELRAVISEVENYKIQIDNFVTQYGGLPGDIPNAQEFFGAVTVNGNNNGRIGLAGSTGAEVFDAWEQLILGRLATGVLDGVDTNADDATIGVNVPRSSYINVAGFSVAWHSSPGGWVDTLNRPFAGNVIIIGSEGSNPNPSNVLQGAALNGEDAFAIDEKIDNQRPDYGKVLAADAFNVGPGDPNCVDDPGGADPATYDFGSVLVTCVMFFLLD